MIFFFYGPNTYAAKHKMRDMAETYVSKAGSDFGLERFDGAVVTFEILGAALTAAPFLANSRLVIIERVGSNKGLVEKIPGLIGQVPESTVAVFYEPEADQRTTYFKTMSKEARAVKFDNLTSQQLSSWIKRETTALRGTIDATAVMRLIEAVGEDQWRLEQELNKLVNFNPQVTVETVKQLVVASSTQSIFDLVEAMSSGQPARALTIFRQLIADRTNELYILTMVTWQLRNLLLAKTSGMSNSAELAKAAGLSPYVAGKALARQRDFSEEHLKTAYLAAIETDYAIKSGHGNAEHLVEQLIYQVATT